MDVKQFEIVQKSLDLIQGTHSQITYYVLGVDTYMQLDDMLALCTDVSYDEVMSRFTHNVDYVMLESGNKQKVLISETGMYMILAMSKLEIGKLFRVFLKKLIQDLKQNHPELLIKAYNKAVEELASYKLRYREVAESLCDAEANITELHHQLDTSQHHKQEQLRILSRLNSELKTVHNISDREVEYMKERELLMKMTMSSIYVYIVPPPKKKKKKSRSNDDIDSDSEDESDVVEIYSKDSPPDSDATFWFEISKTRVDTDKKKELQKYLVAEDYVFKKDLTAAMEKLQELGEGKRKIRTTLGHIQQIIADFRSKGMKEVEINPDEYKKRAKKSPRPTSPARMQTKTTKTTKTTKSTKKVTKKKSHTPSTSDESDSESESD